MITMIKRKKKRFPPRRFSCTHMHELGIGSKSLIWDLNWTHICESATKQTGEWARMYINLVWSCQKVSYLQNSDMRTQPRSSLRKTGFVYICFVCICFFSRSVSRSFFRLFCSVALRIDAAVFFVGSSQNATLRSTAVAPMLYIENVSLCFVFHFSSFIWFANRQRS